MSKILMRSVMNQLDNPKAIDVVTKNLIGDNAGNMIFANSMLHNLMLEDTQIDNIATNKKFNQEDIEYINTTYDYFVIPLANAFRCSFEKELKNLTALIKGLKIPCIVVGVGVQTTVEDDLQHEFVFDQSVKNFVNAVLEKSGIIGVRGEITAKYLERLGYVRERHFTIIGCPSMYMYGGELPEMKVKELTRDSKVSLNRKIDLSKSLHQFLIKCTEELPNYTFIPQGIDDLRLLYTGIPIPENKYKKIPSTYPSRMNHEILLQQKEIGFVNVQTWIDFLRTVDFSFGSRIHGNIASILAGTPCYIFVSDARIRELAEYHNIPHMMAKEINKNTNLYKIHEQTDFSMIQKGHKERFQHFVDFLNQNKLPHIYDKNYVASRRVFQEKMDVIDWEKPILPFTAIPLEEQIQRLEQYHEYQQKQNAEIKVLTNANKELLNKIQQLEKTKKGYFMKRGRGNKQRIQNIYRKIRSRAKSLV